MTYTYVVLDISPEAYKEIADKLRTVDYDHVFTDDGEGREVIDMHGIALREEP